MPSRTIRAAALSLFLVSSAAAFAADVWDGAPFASDPKALLAAAEAIQPKKASEGVIVLLDEAIVTFDADGRSSRVERLIYRVIDQSAVDGWSTIETSWSPWYHERPQVDARVVTKDGAVHRLDPKSFGLTDAEDDPDMFSDTRVLSGPLPAVAPGSVVEQTITYREKNPLYTAGVAERHEFGRWVETRQSRLVIDAPAALALRMVNKTRPQIEPRRSESDGRKRIVFETGPRPRLENFEWNLPSDVSMTSYVAWSTGKSWQEVATRYAEIIDEKIGDGASVAQLTATAVGNAKEPREIARRILATVERQIRYAGVEFGEGSIVPRAPTETLKNKYGDCKDKATLLVAMLRQAGVPAHVALLRSGLGYDVESDLPGLGHFNHVIVVTEGEAPIWIDPTDEFARAGELPDSDQGRLALIARRETTALTLTPYADARANHTVERREFRLAELGKASITEISQYSGSEERSTRRYYTSIDRKQAGEELKSYAENTYLAKKLSKWELADGHDLDKPFSIHLTIDEATRGTTADGEAAVGIFFSRMVSDLPSELRREDPKKEDEAEKDEDEKQKPRQNDYVFARPYVFDLHYRVIPPPGYVVRDLPQPETLQVGTGKLTKNWTANDDGTVLADFRFESGPRRITAAQFEEMRQAAVKIAKEKAFLLYFDQVGRKLLDAGEVGKAVAEFRRLAALHPKEALHQTDIAGALLTGGFGSAARRAAKRAVEIEPTAAHAHAVLGKVLSNDWVGRPLRNGADIPGAIAAYRKAKELDKADIDIRAQLAYLLEYSDAGARFAADARVPQAIDEYIALKKDIEEADDEAIDRELMLLYSHAGRWDDLEKLLATTTDTQSKDAFQLVAIGASKGGAAAVAASARIEPAKRREMQSQAAGLLALLRRYPAATELLSAAANGAPNAAELRAQVDLLRKAVRHEELKLDRGDAVSVFKLAMIETFQGANERDVNKRFASSDVADVFSEDGRRSKAKSNGSEKAMKAVQKKDPQSLLMVDFALSAVDYQQDGDENVGYRIRARAPGMGTKGTFTIYAVKENGEYRIAAGDEGPELALRAFRLVEKNDLAGARRWLDWARDHITASGGEDPVASEPFAAVWTRGKEGTAEEMRLAAAILLPDTKKSAQLAVPVLIAAREKADADTQWRIDQALITANTILEKWDVVLEASDRIAAKFPQSASAFRQSMHALFELKREDEVRTRATARLQKMPGDVAAEKVLAQLAVRSGAYSDAVPYLDGVLQSADPTASDYNEYAWVALFAKSDPEKALQRAREGVTEAPDAYPILNTLAAIYADQGRSSEARDTFLKSLEQSGSDELRSADWYVVGRIAENYGIDDAALEAYQKVTKPAFVPGSPYALAQERLAGLKR
jgi:transglutaminase-like putative cysteine protease/Flp pilus assembly protein TadD